MFQFTRHCTVFEINNSNPGGWVVWRINIEGSFWEMSKNG